MTFTEGTILGYRRIESAMKKEKKTKEPKTIATSGLLFFIGFLVCSTPFHPRLLLTAVPPFRLDGRRCVLPRHRTSKCCKEIQNVIEIMNRRERGVEQCNKSALMPSNSLIPKVYFLSFRLFSRGPSRFFFSTPPPIIHSFFIIPFRSSSSSSALRGQGSLSLDIPLQTLFDTRTVNSCPSLGFLGATKEKKRRFFTAQFTNKETPCCVYIR